MLAQRLQRCETELAASMRENERLRRALRESEGRFHRLVEQSVVGICLTDGRSFSYVNPKFADITGYSVDELTRIMGPLDIVPEAKRSEAAAILRRGLSGEFEASFSMPIHVQRKDGTLVTAELTGGPPVDVDGRPELIAMLADITDRVYAENEIKLLNAKLREQAIRDPLTDLFNRRYLEESLLRELARAERQGQPVSVVMGDLDGFKEVNDRHGHQFGDRVLQIFAEMIRRHCRHSDIPCRYGGEEFLLVMPGMDGHKACERAELLRRLIASAPIVVGESSVQVFASFGVATFPDQAGDMDGLILAADKALYRAKAEGRNRVCGVGDEVQD